MTSIPIRICFCLDRARPWSEFGINTAWDPSREHWWDLITFGFILFLYSFIVCLSPKYTVHPSKWRVELGVWEVLFFPVSGEIGYSFFNFLFDIFWNSTNLAYLSLLREVDLVYDYIFTSQREFYSVLDMNFFAIPSLILSHLELSRIKLPKLTSSILKEIVTISAVLVEFCFYMHQSMKAWLLQKLSLS